MGKTNFFLEEDLIIPVIYTIDSRWRKVIPTDYYEEITWSLSKPPLFLVIPDDDYYSFEKRNKLEGEYSLLFPNVKIIFITSDQELKFLKIF